MLADQVTSELLWYWDETNLAAVSDCFLSFGPDYERNIEAVCAAAGRVSGASFVLYHRRRGGDLVTTASWNAPADLPQVTAGTGRVCEDVMAGGGDDLRVITDLQDTVYAHTSPIVKKYRLRTYCGYPVRAEGRTVASLCALFATDVSLRSAQLELFRVLGRAAGVEEARRLADEDRVLGLAQLEQAMERTVATLSGAMSTRDPYTAGHERRVAQLAVAIGRAMGMGDAELRLLRLAATVHDIGKITVPAEILSKPTRLSEAEFAIIKEHSQAGCDLLGPAELPGGRPDRGATAPRTSGRERLPSGSAAATPSGLSPASSRSRTSLKPCHPTGRTGRRWASGLRSRRSRADAARDTTPRCATSACACSARRRSRSSSEAPAAWSATRSADPQGAADQADLERDVAECFAVDIEREDGAMGPRGRRIDRLQTQGAAREVTDAGLVDVSPGVHREELAHESPARGRLEGDDLEQPVVGASHRGDAHAATKGRPVADRHGVAVEHSLAARCRPAASPGSGVACGGT